MDTLPEATNVQQQRQTLPPQTNSPSTLTTPSPDLPQATTNPITNPRKRSVDSMASSDSIKDLIEKAKRSRAQPSLPPPPEQAMEDSLEKELTCSICTEIVYRPVALIDCLHTFCGFCIKKWLERSLRCPSCRAKIKKCKEDHKQRNLVELFLKSYPEKAMSKEEMEERDAGFQPGEMLNVSRDWDRENDMDEESYEEEEEEEGGDDDHYDDGALLPNWDPCPTCNIDHTAPNPYQFTCPIPIRAGGERGPYSTFRDHVKCSKCDKSVPMGLLPKIKCDSCSDLICGSLFEDGRCRITDEEKLKEVRDVQLKIGSFATYPAFFLGNEVESASFMAWKNENNISDEEIGRRMKDWLFQTNYNRLKLFQRDIPLDLKLCKHCTELCFGENFLAWWIYERERTGLTQNDKRPKCWYGRMCRTQRRNQDHNRRLQHMCEETPQAERINTSHVATNPDQSTTTAATRDGN